MRDDRHITLGVLHDVMESRPLYLHHCGSNEAVAKQRMEENCAAIFSEGGYALKAVRTARVLRNVIEGVWGELVMSNGPYEFSDAVGIVHCCAAAFFPKHFDRRDPRRNSM